MPLALSLAFGLALFKPQHHDPVVFQRHGATVRSQRVAGWTLETAQDRFTGGMVCQLTRGRLSYKAQAVVFHFPSSVDTTHAAYRIDGGPVQLATDDLSAPLEAKVGYTDLGNPSEGILRIPIAKLSAARSVKVQVRAYARPESFRVEGVAKALQAGARVGCNEPNWS